MMAISYRERLCGGNDDDKASVITLRKHVFLCPAMQVFPPRLAPPNPNSTLAYHFPTKHSLRSQNTLISPSTY
ncbi:hypothetical protein E2C01_019838 [Portunus trituberculatus]|uniref:Uncharacterized protein n=1 Tax=Portunus trituberculatus TaxID=210409 RepID=A0A5B7DYI8_PORTR|nr:hypothetical protein [Portunus trituberculatus]